MRYRTIRAGGAVAALAVAVTGCASGAGGDQDPDTISVVTSTNVWAGVVRAVAGPGVDVRAILDDPAADPHSYEGAPADATALAGADLVVLNGGGYDDFFVQLADRAGGTAPRVEAFALFSGQDGAANEHVWYDLPTVRKVADQVAEQLAGIAPDLRDAVTANARAFGGRLDQLADRIAAVGSAAPGAKVLATESVADHLLRAAGLTDATPPEFAEAVAEESDPAPAVVAETLALLTGRRVAVMVDNAQTVTPVTTSLTSAANTAGIPIVQVSETLPEGVTDYVDWMTAQVDALAGALGTT